MTTPSLPELPERATPQRGIRDLEFGPAYSASQMRAYALSAIAQNRAAVGAGAAELPEPAAWLVTGEGINSPQVYLDRQGAESHLRVRNCGVIVPLFAAPLGAVAVDAAPQQNPDSVHQVGVPPQAAAALGQMEAIKSERRAIEFGDLLNRHILVMRAAVVASHVEGPEAGMKWIVNTLWGPGQLPTVEDAANGAQALFDKEVAEHEAFRAAHPAPALPEASTGKTAGGLMREHLDSANCWCEPTVEYVDPDTGVRILVHKDIQ